jgi:cysteine desulfurase
VIYFDYNASAPMSEAAKKAWLEAVEQFPGNPASQHRFGQRSDKALERAALELSEILKCEPGEIIWTSGATESNNLALRQFFADERPGNSIWISPLEHPSIKEPLRSQGRARMEELPLRSGGELDLDALESRLRKRRPSCIAVMAASNENGVIQPRSSISTLARRFDVPFLCDATQLLGRHPAPGLGECDFVTGSAHKFGGPRGVGFLKIPAGRPLDPLLRGGSQQEGRRAGTENVPGALAMVAALREALVQVTQEGFIESRCAWRDAFEARMLAKLPGSAVVCQSAGRLWNTSCMIMPEVDCRRRWVVRLDRKGIAASTGSACASGKEEPSENLLALGFSSQEATRALRFSSGIETARESWATLAETLEHIHAEFTREPAFP